MSDLDLLPKYLADKSISEQEIVLPTAEAIEAIDILESQGYLVLGWEGWVKSSNGVIGHQNAPQGTISLEGLSVASAAQLCRETIQKEAAQWLTSNQGSKDELHICITV
ncbi:MULTISPECIES: hypothetical protein [unclassified Methylophilus]|uniref:hypothetical protein n=1 Tax=unclassified Methylophilus TaxID=2630143 RepID=UPI0006FB7870|nr:MULTISPECIES: hypothetical protein [unclassified Methylophilus]KQT35997.1 hypothetical protein ASG24_06880 [Methylophilus sp. Leaf414]KQT42486.1 hypothetical protein ASG34_07010 [Methylophilus sp. Leaf416]KQT56669.1 hypothetical protein ASG44_06985 [Methylophilus sp. Leaf459]